MNTTTRAVVVAVALLYAQPVTHLFAAAESAQTALDQRNREKMHNQEARSNAKRPDVPPPSFDAMSKQANQGDPAAQYRLGRMYYFGDGVPENREQAARWHAKAADQGHAEAQYVLGLLYSAGDGVRQDREKAAQLIAKAAEQGLAEAQFALGLMYQTGEDVPQDNDKAAEWLAKAAAQGRK